VREALHLRRRYRAILSTTGLILALVGLLMLAPLFVLLAWPVDGASVAGFLLPGLALVAGGLLLWKRLESEPTLLTLQEGGVIVLLSWVAACVASAVPLMAAEGLGPTRAIFEAVSGWTTTGLSVVDVTLAKPVTLLWRSIMQLAGGAGLAIITLSAITGGGGPSLSAAEGRAEQLAPNVLASARLVVRIYTAYVAVGVLALRAAGMSGFDAVNHAFCALSTGGFSTHPESIGFWDSAAIESVTLLLMIFGGMNFVTAWVLFRGRLRAFGKNGEVRLFAVTAVACALLLLALTCAPLYSTVSKALRVAVFETVTALTTTGYSTVGYGNWNAFGILLIIVLMLIGGAAGSTAGGVKQYRVHLLFRSLVRELRRPFLPRTAVVDDSVWQGEERVSIGDARVRTVGAFVFLYLATWLGGAAILAAHGYTLSESLFEFASAVGTVGLSVGITGPDAPRLVLWAETVGMLLGRLEFFVVLASAAKIVRDTARMVRRGS
jgi:trk system potassium uptake protein TrkH